MGDTLTCKLSLQSDCYSVWMSKSVPRRGRLIAGGGCRGEGVTEEVTSELACKDCRSLGGREEGRKAFQSSRTAYAKSQRRERTELVPNGQDWIWLDGRVWGWSSRGRKQSTDSLLCRLAWLFISVFGCGSAKPVMRCR